MTKMRWNRNIRSASIAVKRSLVNIGKMITSECSMKAWASVFIANTKTALTWRRILKTWKSTSIPNTWWYLFLSINWLALCLCALVLQVFKYHCDHGDCKYRTNTSSSFNGHMLRHADSKPYTCEVCGYRTIEAGKLTNHMRTHAKRVRELRCYFKNCSYVTPYLGHRRQHYKDEHWEVHTFLWT